MTEKKKFPDRQSRLAPSLISRCRFSHSYNVKRKSDQLVQSRDALPTSYITCARLQDGLLADSQSPRLVLHPHVFFKL